LEKEIPKIENNKVKIYMIQYLALSFIFILLDAIYLTFIQKYFNQQIFLVQGDNIKINILGTIFTYIFLVFGLYYFIIREKRNTKDAALLGLVIYAVYELTNYSILKKWSIYTVLLDTTWGAILFASTTAIFYKLKSINSIRNYINS
jgi:uncharacterized membrane protein